MTDIEQARKRREQSVVVTSDRRVRELAVTFLNESRNDTAEVRFCGLAIALCALADQLKVDRVDIVAAFGTIAGETPELEIVEEP